VHSYILYTLNILYLHVLQRDIHIFVHIELVLTEEFIEEYEFHRCNSFYLKSF
jgi:hypothetical protein